MFGHICRFPQGDCCLRARYGREIAVREPGTVAAAAKHRKRSKYCNLDATHHFVPIAVETLGVLGQDVRSFFREVARHVVAVTNAP